MCLGDVRQCRRQRGGAAVYRGNLGVAKHLCCLPSCCLQLGLSDNTQKSSCSARIRKKLFPCYKGKLMFFCLFFFCLFFSTLNSLQLSRGSPQGQLCYCMYPFRLFCFGIKGLCEGKCQLLILGFKNTQSDTFFPFDWSKQQSASSRQHSVQPCCNVSSFVFLQTSV